MTNTMNTGHEGATSETTAFYVWKSHVAVKAGASMEDVEINNGRLRTWYDAGEPVWMAADGLRQLVRGRKLADRDGSEMRALRRMSAREVVVGGVPGIEFRWSGK